MTTIIKNLVACLILFVNTAHLYADKYVIVYIPNRGNIYISNKPAKVGTTFDDKNDIIRWTSKSQSFRARLMPEGKSVNDKVFSASKAKNRSISLWDYLRGLYVNLGTKGIEEERLDTFLLLDSLTIGSLRAKTEAQFNAKWKDGEINITTPLPSSIDRNEVYLTRDLFVNTKNRIIELDIWATDNIGSYRVRTIWIELLE